MINGVGARRFTALMVIGLAFASAVVAQSLSVRRLDVTSTYSVGDWLISYANGFVRRGLIGEILLHTPAPLLSLVVTQFTLLSCLVAATLLALRRWEWSWAAIALLCGPLALPVSWDPLGEFRKELFGLVALWAAVLLPRRWGIPVSVVLFTLGVFSWEPLALMVVAFVTVLGRWGFIHVAAGVVAGALSVIFKGGSADVVAICARLEAAHIPTAQLCQPNSAISALGMSPAQALQMQLAAFPAYLGYILPAVLGLAPLLLAYGAKGRGRTAIVTILPLFALFAVGVDYGRWLHIIAVVLAAILFHMGRPEATINAQWTGLPTLAFITLWAPPHVLNLTTPEWQWFGFAATVARRVTQLLS